MLCCVQADVISDNNYVYINMETTRWGYNSACAMYEGSRRQSMYVYWRHACILPTQELAWGYWFGSHEYLMTLFSFQFPYLFNLVFSMLYHIRLGFKLISWSYNNYELLTRHQLQNVPYFSPKFGARWISYILNYNNYITHVHAHTYIIVWCTYTISTHVAMHMLKLCMISVILSYEVLFSS